MVVFLTEIIPSEVRTAGFSLAYSLATAIFGGFTPAICTYFIHLTGNKAVPGLWLSVAAACALFATLVLTSRRTGGGSAVFRTAVARAQKSDSELRIALRFDWAAVGEVELPSEPAVPQEEQSV